MVEADNTHSTKEVPPRILHDGISASMFDITNDFAVRDIARMIVAGVDERYSLHPGYQSFVASHGLDDAQRLIKKRVSIPGDKNIQTAMHVQRGAGLFGGLSESGTYFIFYEWRKTEGNQMWVTMTTDEARKIVNGEQKKIVFYPV